MRTRLLLLALLPLSCKPAPEPAASPAPLSGRGIFMARCIACHQPDGSGLAGICPPLENSPALSGPPENLIRILLLGMKGGIVRHGSAYSGIMPAWRFDLNDGQIADVINDLCLRWNPGAPAITGEMIRRIRDETASQKLFPTASDPEVSESPNSLPPRL